MSARNRIRLVLIILPLAVIAVAAVWAINHWILASFRNGGSVSVTTAEKTHSMAQDEDDIAEAVFKSQMRECLPDKPREMFFLFRNERENPGAGFMKRFDKSVPTVKSIVDGIRHVDGIADINSGKRGLLLGVGKINWLNDTEVEVNGSCFADQDNWVGFVYEVVRDGNHWIVKGSKLTLIT